QPFNLTLAFGFLSDYALVFDATYSATPSHCAPTFENRRRFDSTKSSSYELSGAKFGDEITDDFYVRLKSSLADSRFS
ncbi:hypothetical protein AAVH_31441, partial [Aphelenchoides avenae]